MGGDVPAKDQYEIPVKTVSSAFYRICIRKAHNEIGEAQGGQFIEHVQCLRFWLFVGPKVNQIDKLDHHCD